MSGLLGVGGGVIMVPLLVIVARMDQRSAYALSLGAMIAIAAGLIRRARRIRVDDGML